FITITRFEHACQEADNFDQWATVTLIVAYVEPKATAESVATTENDLN
ncbi:hypothetical protein NPIL_375101, partial [Nephila pilipes]